MTKDFVYLGGNNYLPTSNIAMIMGFDEPTAKTLIKKAKDTDAFLDFSRGKSKQTVILTRNNLVVASARSADDITSTCHFP